MSIKDKTFHHKNRAVRIACKTPLIVLSPFILAAVFLEPPIVEAYRALKKASIPNVKAMLSVMREGYLD